MAQKKVYVNATYTNSLLERYYGNSVKQSRAQQEWRRAQERYDAEGKELAYMFRKKSKAVWKTKAKEMSDPPGSENITSTPMMKSDLISIVRTIDAARQNSNAKLREEIRLGSRGSQLKTEGSLSTLVHAPITQEDVLRYGTYLGLSPPQLAQPDVFALVNKALAAPLPDGWQECYDPQGTVFYYNESARISQWEHPLEGRFREMCRELAQCNNALQKAEVLERQARFKASTQCIIAVNTMARNVAQAK
eukprot:Rmarinus@m.21563